MLEASRADRARLRALLEAKSGPAQIAAGELAGGALLVRFSPVPAARVFSTMRLRLTVNDHHDLLRRLANLAERTPERRLTMFAVFGSRHDAQIVADLPEDDLLLCWVLPTEREVTPVESAPASTPMTPR